MTAYDDAPPHDDADDIAAQVNAVYRVPERLGDGWETLSSRAILEGTWERPTPTLGTLDDGVGLIYPGRTHSLAGEPGGGKTWLALHIVHQLLDAGMVTGMIDYEDEPQAIFGRLLALGADREALAERFVYVRPDQAVHYATIEGLAGLGADLWVIDSVGEALAAEGLNPNADEDVVTWFRKVPRLLCAGGAAVLMIDHVAKSKEERGSWAIGSQRKLAALNGAAYTVETVTAPTTDGDGLLHLKCAKDRHGTHRRHQRVAEVSMVNQAGERLLVTMRRPSGGPELRPTVYMERVSLWLETFASSGPHSTREVLRLVEGKDRHKKHALELLTAEGYVESIPDGKALSHRLVRPYRQSDDPQSDRYEHPGRSQYEALQAVDLDEF